MRGLIHIQAAEKKLRAEQVLGCPQGVLGPFLLLGAPTPRPSGWGALPPPVSYPAIWMWGRVAGDH